jgi:DNA replication and repair protein RecF
VVGFRNLAPLTLEPGPGFNVFAGDNGHGKTNLLEAIYAVCTLRSFRTRRLAELIGFGRTEARLGAEVERGSSVRTYELTLTPGGRQVRLDAKTVRPASRYFGGFQVVLFAPEDLTVARGAPADRRAFLDRAVFQRASEYLGEAQDYDKVLRSRNAVLRAAQGRGPAAGRPRDSAGLLAVYDERLAELGARRVRRRASLVAELTPRMRAAFAAISRGDLAADARYAPAWLDAGADLDDEPALVEGLAKALAGARPVDLARAVTTVGPHRDDLDLTLDGRSAASFASQGQLRALILAWKIAELELLAEAHGEAPVLLLDDVSSELDPQRNQYLFDFLCAKRTQCFVTTTHPRYVLAASDRMDFEVRSGTVTRQNAE